MPERPQISIRQARPADRAAVVACVEAAYVRYVDTIGREPAPMLDDYGRLIDLGRVWLATIDGDVVGLIVMWPERDHLYVDNLAVDPGHQGKGIGSELLRHADRRARLAGHSEIRLYTNEAMTSNTEYYPKRGFVETHRAVEDGYRRIFYSRTIVNG